MADIIRTPKNGNPWIFDAALDTEGWLADVCGEDVGAPEGSDWDNGDSIASAISKDGSRYVQAYRDNVYNHENDFSSVFTFTVYAPEDADEWFYADCYIAVCVHRGGDVRGNYEGPRLYRVESPADAGFFDWVVGWYVTTEDGEPADAPEEFGVGYAPNPTCHLVEWLGSEDGEWVDGAFVSAVRPDIRCFPSRC